MPSKSMPCASEIVEPLRMGHGQRAQQQGVDEAKCGGAGSDAESQGQNGRGGSHFSLGELPPTEDGIGAERIEPREQAQVAALVALAQRGAECAADFGGVAAPCMASAIWDCNSSSISRFNRSPRSTFVKRDHQGMTGSP